MKVYHGSTSIVERPIANAGRDRLDFGKGRTISCVSVARLLLMNV